MLEVRRTLSSEFHNRLAELGRRESEFQDASEIVAFGSRAAGVSTDASDLDVLVIGSLSRRTKRLGLDLVRIASREISTPEWLSSELATHISMYGVWLKGSGLWRDRVSVDTRTVATKTRRLLSLIRATEIYWAQLHPSIRRKYKTTLRREFQRLDLLLGGEAIPPTPMLDGSPLGASSSALMLVEAEGLPQKTLNFLKHNLLT